MMLLVAIVQVAYAVVWAYSAWFFWPSFWRRLRGGGHDAYDMISAWDAGAGLGLMGFPLKRLATMDGVTAMTRWEIAVLLCLEIFLAMTALGKISAARGYLRLQRRGR